MNITRLSDVKSQKQEFILKDVMPLPKNTVAMLSSSGGVAKTWLGLRIAMKHVKDTDEEVMLWMTEDEAPFIKNRADSLSQYAKVETDYRKIHLINDAPPQLAKREGGVFKANYEALKEVRSECIDRGITFIVLDHSLLFMVVTKMTMQRQEYSCKVFSNGRKKMKSQYCYYITAKRMVLVQGAQVLLLMQSAQCMSLILLWQNLETKVMHRLRIT